MKPIAVGDLVLLLNTPCHIHDALAGSIRTVEAPSHVYKGEWRLLPADYHEGNRLTWHSMRLKRIPPLDELEGVKSEEKLKESV